jgi:leader peptidase (prepilin peptidase)/N-methyltransferase
MLELFGFLFFNSILFRSSSLFILGICLGSFFNVVAYRLPMVLLRNWRNECIELLGSACQIKQEASGINLIHPSSHCPKCNGKIPVWANIPVVGYFMVRGRCISCGLLISPRYPLVELITGLLFVALGLIIGEPLEC